MAKVFIMYHSVIKVFLKFVIIIEEKMICVTFGLLC